MFIPEKLKSGGHEINISEVSEEYLDGGTIAQYAQRYQAIHFSTRKVSESKKAETFLHEIVEHVNADYELELPHDKLTVLSEILFGILRNNNLDFRKEKKK